MSDRHGSTASRQRWSLTHPPLTTWPLRLRLGSTGAVVCAHNLPFDSRMLVNEYGHAGVEVTIEGLNTLGWARGKLGVVCAERGIVLDNAHAALSDARATAQLLLHVSDRFDHDIRCTQFPHCGSRDRGDTSRSHREMESGPRSPRRRTGSQSSLQPRVSRVSRRGHRVVPARAGPRHGRPPSRPRRAVDAGSTHAPARPRRCPDRPSTPTLARRSDRRCLRGQCRRRRGVRPDSPRSSHPSPGSMPKPSNSERWRTEPPRRASN